MGLKIRRFITGTSCKRSLKGASNIIRSSILIVIGAEEGGDHKIILEGFLGIVAIIVIVRVRKIRIRTIIFYRLVINRLSILINDI